MEFKRYQKGDLSKILNISELKAFQFVPEDSIDPNLSWSFYDDNALVACGGFVQLWFGVYEAWVHVLDYDTFLSYKICLIKKFRREISQLDYHRLQATVNEKTINYQKFMHLLGFTVEGTLKFYGPTKDNHIMFARVR